MPAALQTSLRLLQEVVEEEARVLKAAVSAEVAAKAEGARWAAAQAAAQAEVHKDTLVDSQVACRVEDYPVGHSLEVAE